MKMEAIWFIRMAKPKAWGEPWIPSCLERRSASSCLRCVCCGMFLPRGRVDWCLSCRWLIGDFRFLPLVLPRHLFIEDGARLDQRRYVQIMQAILGAWPVRGLFLN
jgi:hypothetical protein